MRAAMSEGDLSSWNVAGAYRVTAGRDAHARLRPDLQPAGLRGRQPGGAGGGRRTTAGMSARSSRFDRWTVAPRLTVDYGGALRALRLPAARRPAQPAHVGVASSPSRARGVVTSVAQRMVAPGAEEFLADERAGAVAAAGADVRAASRAGGSGEPPRRARAHGRTSLSSTSSRTRRSSASSGSSSDVDDQLVTLFGLHLPDGPDSAGHYFVASAGGVDADGWAFRLSNIVESAAQGLDRLQHHPDALAGRWRLREGASTPRPADRLASRDRGSARHHDVARDRHPGDRDPRGRRLQGQHRLRAGDQTQPGPGLDGRFNVQLNQALPFDFAGTRWEILVGVRNLFRDPTDPASVYDELLVVRPPKRVVGGFLVRF